MPSYDVIYELLLKRYKEKGFLTPKAALDSSIRSLVMKERTKEEAILELNSSDSPWTYSPATSLTDNQQEKGTEQNIAVLGQISNLREKIDSLTTLFSKSEITEETYLRGVRKLEEHISSLQREYKIPKAEQKRTPRSISETARRQTIEEPEETTRRHHHGSADTAWWLVPFFFGLIGGIIAYVAVKNDDKGMADNLLIFGFLWSFAQAFLSWILILH